MQLELCFLCHAVQQMQVRRPGVNYVMKVLKSAGECTQNVRLSKSLQMCCQQDNFMVVNQKVVKVVSIWSYTTCGFTLSCHNEDFLTTFRFMSCQNRQCQYNNLIELIVVSAITFWRPYDNLSFCVSMHGLTRRTSVWMWVWGNWNESGCNKSVGPSCYMLSGQMP